MRPRVVLLAIAVALTIQALAQQQHLPDPATGEIDGKQAVLLWPADGRVIGCQATLVSESDPDTEIHHACGKWFVPPLGKYKVWIEGPSSITPAPVKLIYTSHEFRGKGMMAVIPRTAAGEIGLRAPFPGTSLRLLNLDSFASGHGVAPAFDRRTSGENVRPVRMPTGRVLVGVFDRDSGDAVALAPPVDVTTGRVAYAEPALPKRGTDVLVVLNRPRVRARSDAEVVSLQLHVDGEHESPAVFADSADRVYAVWYGVEGRRARVVANGRELTFPGREFPLRPRRVITVRGRLRALPKLSVEIVSGAELPRDVRVQAKRLSGEILTEVALHDTTVDLGHLPAEPVEVVLLSPDIELRQRVDLTNGIDETVQFRPDPLTIHGHLTRGDRGVTGTIAFTLATRKPVTVVTKDDGSYTARLWSAGTYRIAAAASGAAPFELTRHIMRDTELSIDLPRANVEIRVVDEKSNTAVAGARIVATPGSADAAQAVARAQSALTDEHGTGTLPPINPGMTRISVIATEYLTAERVIYIADTDDTQHFTVELTPVGADGRERITLRLADGTPASAAELMLMDAGTMSQPLWSGRADAAGVVAVPAIQDTILLIRHPQAGSIAVAAIDGLELRLPAPAPPLAVRFVRANGMPARHAGITVWMRGIRISSGSALGFLYRVPNATNHDGVWRANNLPQASLRILAVTSDLARSAPAAALDPLALTVLYPWSELPTLRVAE